MSRSVLRTVPAVALLVLAVASSGVFERRVAGQGGTMPSTRNGDWTHYTADVKGSRYIPLDQVNAGNFSKLEVAWRFKTDNLANGKQYIIVAVSGGAYSGEYIAFSLPDSELRSQQR